MTAIGFDVKPIAVPGISAEGTVVEVAVGVVNLAGAVAVGVVVLADVG